jgi:hypothetical protein
MRRSEEQEEGRTGEKSGEGGGQFETSGQKVSVDFIVHAAILDGTEDTQSPCVV